MTSSSKISVIISTFNSENHIDSAIKSVLRQTYSNWEIIIVDGGSKDETLNIIQEYVRLDNRITLINNQNDRGPAHARSTGIKVSKGSYIAFLDSDDIWLPSKLELQIKKIVETNSDIICTGYRILTNDGKYVSCSVPIHSKYNFSKALCSRGITASSVMVKKNCFTNEILNTIGRFHGEDYLWWLKILRNGGIAISIKESLMLYRDVPTSLSKARLKHQISIWQIYRQELQISFFYASACYCLYIIDVFFRRFYIKFKTFSIGMLNVKTLFNE